MNLPVPDCCLSPAHLLATSQGQDVLSWTQLEITPSSVTSLGFFALNTRSLIPFSIVSLSPSGFCYVLDTQAPESTQSKGSGDIEKIAPLWAVLS